MARARRKLLEPKPINRGNPVARQTSPGATACVRGFHCASDKLEGTRRAVSRITFPYRNIERLRDRPETSWTIDARVTYLYQLFPNVMLATFPDLMLMVVIDPLDVEHSSVITYAMVRLDLAERAARDPGPNNPAGAASFIARGAVEDNEMSEGVQRGLHSGANEFVEFGRHESAIGHFHASLDERLARFTA